MGNLDAMASAPVTTGAEARRQLVEICEPIRWEADFGEIFRKNHAPHPLLSQVETVAPTDSTVLVPGEVGTGKGLVARGDPQRERQPTP